MTWTFQILNLIKEIKTFRLDALVKLSICHHSSCLCWCILLKLTGHKFIFTKCKNRLALSLLLCEPQDLSVKYIMTINGRTMYYVLRARLCLLFCVDTPPPCGLCLPVTSFPLVIWFRLSTTGQCPIVPPPAHSTRVRVEKVMTPGPPS